MGRSPAEALGNLCTTIVFCLSGHRLKRGMLGFGRDNGNMRTRPMRTIDSVSAEWWTQPDQILGWIERGVMPCPVLLDGVPRWSEEVLLDWETHGFPRSEPPTPQTMARIRLGVLREDYRDVLDAIETLEKET